MYHTIRMILQYDTIHMIHTLYRTIHEHLRYADTIRNFLHTILYVLYDTNNYVHNCMCIKLIKVFYIPKF